MRRLAFSAWATALAALMLFAAWFLFWQPEWAQPGSEQAERMPPPSDLPARADVRLVRGMGPSTVRPTDRLLEVMTGQSMPFAVTTGDILKQAARATRASTAAIVVTLDGTQAAGGVLPGFVDAGWARVDDVLMNKSGQSIPIGSRVWVTSRMTSVTQHGPTTVVTRPEWMRALRAGGRYLMFMWSHGGAPLIPAVSFGNTFEIRGPRTVLTTFANREDWRRSADTARLFRVVRSRRHLPPLAPGDVDPLEVLAP